MATGSSSPPPFARRRLSFRTVLYLLFSGLVTLTAVGTGLLAFFNGQESAQDVAVMLRDEYSHRISESVVALLRGPERINELNFTAIISGDHSPDDMAANERRFRRQLDIFPHVSWIAYGERTGRYLAYERLADRFQVETSPTGVDETTRWSVDQAGRRKDVLEVASGWVLTDRPWYTAALKAGKPTWTAPYAWYAFGGICIDHVRPVYDAAGQVRGVLETGFTLARLSRALQDLPVGRLGRSFIVDRHGHLVASSAADAFEAGPKGSQVLRPATESRSRLIRASAAFISAHAGQLESIAHKREFEFEGPRGPVYLQVSRLPHTLGLDWLLVVAVPEREFMTHVDANTENTIILSLAGLLLALGLGAFTVRWIGRPLVALADQARRIQRGELQVEFVSGAQDEIGLLTRTMGEMVKGLREREMIREVFGRYVDPEFAEAILNRPDVFEPGGTVRSITVLMSDLRGFTSLTNLLGAAGMVALLNRYFERMTGVIHAHHGAINDFVGDAILVLFGINGAPGEAADHAARCAVAMQRELATLNEELGAEGLPRLDMGIGVHTGTAVVGNIGSLQRAKFGVVGDAVNIAARIESLTVGTQSLISQETVALLTTEVCLGESTETRVKGRSEPLVVHVLTDEDDVSPGHDGAPWCEVDYAVRVLALMHKTAHGPAVTGRVRALSQAGLELAAPVTLECLQDLTLNIEYAPQRWTDDISAKVTAVGPGHIRAAFTWLSPAARSELGLDHTEGKPVEPT